MTLPDDAVTRLAELVHRHGLRTDAERHLLCLAELLAFDPLAPTAIRDPLSVVDDHLADSLVALELAPVAAAAVIADIGSGAGLPGLPLAVARSDATVYLVESHRRKAEFIARAARECGIDNVRVVASRAEGWRAGFSLCDLVTARALAPLNVVEEYAAPLLKLGGALLAWRGRDDPQAEMAAGRAAGLLGLEVLPAVRVFPYPEAGSRHLHVIVKVAPTPPRFPRRAGMAVKRPLGGYSPKPRS